MQYRVDTESIEQVAGQVQQKHQEILGTITELRSLNSSLDGYWDGEAQQAFEASFGDWLVQLEQFSETLESVQQYLVRYVAARRELEEQAASAASGGVA
jgi:WXG100 family type VII secretion target